MHSSPFTFGLACTALVVFAPCSANAQNATPASPVRPVSATPASSNPLTIAMPPGAVVTFEVDGRDSDLLGMVKTLLSSLDTAISTSTAKPSANTKKAIAFLEPLAGFLSEKRISDILKDVRHLHVVVYDKSRPLDEKSTAAGLTPPAAGVPFHEPLLVKEGGRRLLYSGRGIQVLLMDFDAPHGMAVVVDDDDTVTVARTEGYVDMKALTTWLLLFAAEQDASETTPAHPAPKVKPTATQKPRRVVSASRQK